MKRHGPVTLFLSYAHQDEALRNELEKHLNLLQRQDIITTWHDRQIVPGTDWAHEIDVHLNEASVILLLVSSDFLASDYCHNTEMQRALERHKHGEASVIPIILRPCDWQNAPFAHLQLLPRHAKPVTSWKNPDEAFVDITQGLRRVIQQQTISARPVLPLSSIARQNRQRLLKRVRLTWIDGLLTPSLHHAARIKLYLQDRPDVQENPWQPQVQEIKPVPLPRPDGTSIEQIYDEADSELLILGEPGAGKTLLLLELTRTLLERAEKDERLRMPIVFHLSSWAEKRQLLSTWLVEELSTKYQVPRKVGQGWIDADQVLPLLDGLDEVEKDARTACVQAINTYYQSRLEERGDSPIAVCCRSEEYTALSTRVMLQHAVSILPLTDKQINTYLGQAGEQVKGLRQVLNKDVELRELARQPLMLNLFTLTYQGSTAADVPAGETREKMRHTIFARYVERMLERRKESKRWKPEQVIRWLTFLAKQMEQHDQTVFSVENLQPIWLSRKWRILYQWCVGLVGGLVVGLLGWLAGWLAAGQMLGLLDGLPIGLISGLGFGLNRRIDPAEVLTWSWKEAQSGLVRQWVFWLGFVLFGGQMAWRIFGLPAGLLFGLLNGLLFGLETGLISGLSGKQLPERLSLSPNEGIWHSGKNGLLVGLLSGLLKGLRMGLMAGLTAGVMVGLLFGLHLGLTAGVMVGLLFGLHLGLMVGLMAGLAAFVKHFILRFFLSRRDDLPWDLIPFLDEMARRLLLRKVGGSYIFVHRLLLDYFGALESPSTKNKESALSPAVASLTHAESCAPNVLPESPSAILPESSCLLPCGHDLRLKARFCSVCGAPVSS